MFIESKKFRENSQKAPETAGTILLVDANPLDLETYADVLRHFGHEVRTCSSYEKARHILQSRSFDVVIIGQTGSDFAGREVLEQLLSEGDRIPSLVLSKNTDADAYVQAISLGAADCIGKPVPPQRLKHAVDACLLPQTSEVGCP
jgi:DNA-binding NtrC family response regulator